MRRTTICLATATLLIGCGERSAGDNVRAAYDDKADAVEANAAAQPTETGRAIYQSHAEAIREEGKDREKGLKGGEPSSGQGATQGAAAGQ